MAEEPGWLTRLREETADLQKRTDALHLFINDPAKLGSLPEVIQNDLVTQRYMMDELLAHLRFRIARVENENV